MVREEHARDVRTQAEHAVEARLVRLLLGQSPDDDETYTYAPEDIAATGPDENADTAEEERGADRLRRRMRDAVGGLAAAALVASAGGRA